MINPFNFLISPSNIAERPSTREELEVQYDYLSREVDISLHNMEAALKQLIPDQTRTAPSPNLGTAVIEGASIQSERQDDHIAAVEARAKALAERQNDIQQTIDNQADTHNYGLAA